MKNQINSERILFDKHIKSCNTELDNFFAHMSFYSEEEALELMGHLVALKESIENLEKHFLNQKWEKF